MRLNPRIRTSLAHAAAILAVMGWAVPWTCGHDSPEHVVEALTARIAQTGVTAELLLLRATELRVLQRFDEAASDLQRALLLHPDHLEARAALGRVYLAQGKKQAARVTLDEAIEQAGGSAEAHSLHMIRAEIRWALGETNEALADCQHAMRAPHIPLDWYLMRSHYQIGLGQTCQAVQGLREGFDRTGSFVLQTEWIEALIDDGRHDEALGAIEPQLDESRWKSAWLVRRGRARLGQGDGEGARADLHQALRELNVRQQSGPPDLMMLADRGLARALLGDRPGARRDLESARQLGGDTWLLHRLEREAGQDGRQKAD